MGDALPQTAPGDCVHAAEFRELSRSLIGDPPRFARGRPRWPTWRDDRERGHRRDRTEKGPGLAPGARGSAGATAASGVALPPPPRSLEARRPAVLVAPPASGSVADPPRPTLADVEASVGGRPTVSAAPRLGRLAGPARALRSAFVYCVPVGLAHPPQTVLLAGLGREVGDRRLVRLDPEPRRSDALPHVRHVRPSFRSPTPHLAFGGHPSLCWRDDARPKIGGRPMTTTASPRPPTARGATGSRVRRGGPRPAPRQPGELADPPEGAAGRPRRRARPGRLGPAGPRQPAHRLRRRRPRPRRARALPRRAERAGPVRRPRSRRRRRSSSRPSTRSARWPAATTRSSEALLADVTVDDAGLARPARRPRRQRTEGRAHRPRRGARAARGALRQAGRAVAARRPPDAVRRRDERGRRRAAARRGGADAARDRPALRRPARPDLARRRVQRTAQAGEGLGRRGRCGEAVHDGRGPRRDDAQAEARAPHRGPSQHLDQHGHPGRLVRGVRPRAVAPGRLRLVRERPHPRGAPGPARHRLRARRPDHLGQGPLLGRALLVPLGPRALRRRPPARRAEPVHRGAANGTCLRRRRSARGESGRAARYRPRRRGNAVWPRQGDDHRLAWNRRSRRLAGTATGREHGQARTRTDPAGRRAAHHA